MEAISTAWDRDRATRNADLRVLEGQQKKAEEESLQVTEGSHNSNPSSVLKKQITHLHWSQENSREMVLSQKLPNQVLDTAPGCDSYWIQASQQQQLGCRQAAFLWLHASLTLALKIQVGTDCFASSTSLKKALKIFFILTG